MVSYKPIRLHSDDMPNVLPIKMITVIGIGITALEKEMALCGGKNMWDEYCGMPVYYSRDKSLRDVVCGMCFSNQLGRLLYPH
jgi:hypothetical protein